MKKGEIVKAIRDYVNNDKANYAVLINGSIRRFTFNKR